ncbi:glycosyltransferase [Anaerorhabdus sp.]|uniref:glycosyltransferase n=1 Tax=Anaerorhabdus sp. TaxID=1872524 RepID=UPI002FC97DB8
MKDKRRILFVNDEMRMGGVARVLNTLMSQLDTEKYEIDCLVLHKRGMLLDEIPDYVHVIEGTPFFNTVDEPLMELIKRLDIGRICSKIRLLFYMKTGLIKKKIGIERNKIIKKPYDVEVAAKEGFCTIFTAFGDSKKKINWVLTDYSVCNYSKRHMKIVKESLEFIDLNIADSKQALEAYEKVFGIKREKGISIHNLMDVDRIKQNAKDSHDSNIKRDNLNVIAVARFHPQKSLERLLYAHKYAIEKGYNHSLFLIGGGETEPRLRTIVKENNLTNVLFLGYKLNPYADIAACDLFVLSSLYEGFATIVNESLISGTPVLSTKVSGIQEQLTEVEYGWIVENNQQALNIGYVEAIKNPEKLAKMKENLQAYHYPNEKILQEFMEVL